MKNESAFPIIDGIKPEYGLTKREYFAGLAMQGILAGAFGQGTTGQCVELSVEYADALLEELAKEKS